LIDDPRRRYKRSKNVAEKTLTLLTLNWKASRSHQPNAMRAYIDGDTV
jgi:hypothetical protein